MGVAVSESPIADLQTALKRVAMVRDWCGIAGLPNVKTDMQKAVREIEGVIYLLQRKSPTIEAAKENEK